MNNGDGSLPWEAADWTREVETWIGRVLARHGIVAGGRVEFLHKRPWAAFARIPTAAGPIYFKAPAPPFFEAPLTQLLGRLQPQHTVNLLAIHEERGWLLSADSGITVRAADPTAGQVEHWVRLLPLYAEFQIEMVDHLTEILATGIFDRRLTRLPSLFTQLMETEDDLRIGLEDGLSAEEAARLRAAETRVGQMCSELDAFNLPESLTHEEVHDANVLVDREQYLFTDWSDASVSHPFISMLVTLRAAAHRLKLPEDGPELDRLRDAYLEPWTRFESRPRLDRALKLAYSLGMLNRALSWHQGMAGLAARHREPYSDYVPGWLQDFLQALD